MTTKIREFDNPFNQNYLFTKDDLKRANLTWEDKLKTLLRPMLIQITVDGVFRFKVGSHGEIYMFGMEELPRSKPDD